MFRKAMLGVALVGACTLGAADAVAGTGQGKVGSILVGRLGYQVFVQLVNPLYNGFACGTPGTGWTYAFSTQVPGGKDMLATLLAAKAQGIAVTMVGSATCNQDAALEDVGYVITNN